MLVSSASGLVWSMNWRELAAAEELLHGRHDGADVDERVGGRLLDLLDRHALLDHALHAQQADAEGVLDELAVGADAAVAEVVDVVGLAEAVVELDEVADDGRDVLAVMVRSARGSSMPIRSATGPSFLLNL